LLAAKVTPGETTRLSAEFVKVAKNAAHRIPGETTQPSVLLVRAQVKKLSAALMESNKLCEC
jgi:hypothetical protein